MVTDFSFWNLGSRNDLAVLAPGFTGSKARDQSGRKVGIKVDRIKIISVALGSAYS